MPITYRPVSADEYEAFNAAEARGFSAHPKPALLELERGLFEPERSVVSFDGDLIVGTCGSLTFEMSAPGGALLPAAGVSYVTVSPTHRRRGILTEMMRRQLEGVRERGEPVAALWASESVIYGRFGYGMAMTHEQREIDRRHTAYSHAPDIRGQVRFVDADQASGLFPAILDRACSRHPGMIRRSDPWWKAVLSDLEPHRRGASAFFHAVYEVDGAPAGYVTYRMRHNVTDGHENNTVVVHEMVADHDEATAALWRFCFDIDLASTIVARGAAPVDDGLVWMLADPRRLTRRPYDGLWLRLVDVPAALAARSYRAEGSLVIQLDDAFCGWNDGRWLLEAGPDGAACSATRRAPDIALSASDLAAVYLGGHRASELARAERIMERKPGALERADAMFSSARAPWNLVEF